MPNDAVTDSLCRQPSEVDFCKVMQILIDRLHGDRDHLYLIEKDSNAKTALDYLIQTDHEMACDPIVYLVQKLPDSMRNAVILDYLHTLTVSKTSCSHKISVHLGLFLPCRLSSVVWMRRRCRSCWPLGIPRITSLHCSALPGRAMLTPQGEIRSRKLKIR